LREKNDFLQFISQQLNIEYFNFEPRNVIVFTEEHNDIVKYVNKSFKQMNYNKNDKENILLKNIDFVNQYLRLYKNNIL
jgi:hemerythrin-like domain-containing protein